MKDKPKVEFNFKPKIKFVRKSGQWCKTSWLHGKQVQEWSYEKPQPTEKK